MKQLPLIFSFLIMLIFSGCVQQFQEESEVQELRFPQPTNLLLGSWVNAETQDETWLFNESQMTMYQLEENSYTVYNYSTVGDTIYVSNAMFNESFQFSFRRENTVLDLTSNGVVVIELEKV